MKYHFLLKLIIACFVIAASSLRFFVMDVHAYQPPQQQTKGSIPGKVLNDTILKLKDSLNQFPASDENKAKAEICKSLGEIYYYRALADSAAKYYEQSLNLYEKLGDSIPISRIYNNLALVDMLKNKYAEALEKFIQSMTIKKRTGDSTGLGNVYLNIGALHHELNTFDQALMYFRNAISFFDPEKDPEKMAIIYNNIGIALQRSEQPDSALYYYRMSLKYSKQSNDSLGMANSLMNIGDIYQKRGDNRKALEYYNRSHAIRTEGSLPVGLSYLNIAKIYELMEEPEKAIVYYRKALSADSINLKSTDRLKILKSLYEIYRQKKKYKEALSYFSRYHSLWDSLNTLKYSEKLLQVHSDYESREREKEYQLLKQKRTLDERTIDLYEERSKRQQFLVRFLIILLIIILIATFAIFHLYQLKNKVNRKLKRQNEEISQGREELKRKNEAIRNNEIRFRQIVQGMPVIVLAFDDNYNIVFWNNEGEKNSGYERTELTGNLDLHEKVFPKSAFVENRDQNSGFNNVQWDMQCKDGSRRVISWTNVGEDAPVKGWKEWLIGIDVTEINEYESALIESRETLNRIYESSPDSILVFDLENRIINCNSASLKLFKLDSKNSLLGDNFFSFVSDDHKQKVGSMIDGILEKRHLSRIEVILINGGGMPFSAEISADAILDSRQSPMAIVTVIKDVTEKVQFVEKLREAKERAEEADTLKSAFLANMSHEIRTPMNAIIGFASLLSEEENTPEMREEYVTQISNNSNTLLHLINDIIDFSKIEAGQMNINEIKCFPETIVSDVYRSFAGSSRLKPEVNFFLCKSNEQEAPCITDPVRIKQVLNNLVSNSMKFTEQGSIEIGYETVKGYLLFFVRDTGIGIPTEKQELIFDRFRQADDSHTRKYGGTGLGLAISRKLIEMLDGEIWVESEVNRGSTFYFKIPCHVSEDMEL